MFTKKGQITIFVIVAIIVVVIGVAYFAFRDVITQDTLPASIDPVQLAVLGCIEDRVEMGISILSSSGGYITLPEFSAGSRYQPFSSYLDFAGTDIPYWFYMSASNFARTQVPTVSSMELDLERFLNEQMESCYLEEFRDSGYTIDVGPIDSTIQIERNYVDAVVSMDVTVATAVDVAVLQKHEVRVDSNLGYLFEEAVSVYNEAQSTFFLENYTIDVLRLYAPVDGVELSCSPRAWEASEVHDEVRSALEFNTLQLRNRGSDEEYYNINLESRADVRFLYSQDWTSYFEVNPTEDNVLVAKPVGNTQELGALGFCYVPYHFVYNFRHPVLIQVSRDDEIFQFPMAVLIEGNLPREAVGEASSIAPQINVCENTNQGVSLTIYDEDLNPLEAAVSYECVGVSCDVVYEGGDSLTVLPQCANGVLRIAADGYKPYRSVYSSVGSGSLAVVLEKEYTKELRLVAADRLYDGKALVTFTSEESSQSIVYPETKQVALFPGVYEIQLYLYNTTEFTLPATRQEQCYTVPRSGLLGAAGLTRQECSIVEVPEQVITDALVGGGLAEYSFSSAELEVSDALELSVDRLIVPDTFEELQANYLLFDVADVEVSLL